MNIKKRDRERKTSKKVLAEKPTPESFNSSTCSAPNSYSKQAFGKAKNTAKKHLHKSPAKRKQVLSYLLQTLSPTSKSDVYNATRLICTFFFFFFFVIGIHSMQGGTATTRHGVTRKEA